MRLRFLSLEDKPLDADMIQLMLLNGGIDCELRRVETRSSFISALETDEFDLILADYALPSFDGLTALELARDLRPDIPFILISGSLGEELAIEALKLGATDYVLKQRLERLVPCVERALREAQASRDRKQAEATIAADLHDTQLLRDLSVRLTSEADIQVLYNEIMAAAIALTRADAGTVQILDDATQDLVLLATQGFDPNFIVHFHWVNAGSQTSCGLTLRNGQRTFTDFDDPEQDDADGSLQRHVEAGYRSAQSTPLVTRWGRLLGMVSTHWCHHHRPTERELRFLDLLARQAADLIAQRQVELERNQMLEREQAARAEAEPANRIKDDFLAILSHELRSPLNPILGWSQMLQTRPPDPDTARQALAIIERNAKLQIQLIDDLLDINRILRGKLHLETATVDLVAVVEAAIEVVSTAAQTKSIALRFSHFGACHVTGDEGRLQQIVWNLLTNAIKFTPNGGQVQVHLEPINGQAQITVTDTGQGISPDFMPYVFQSFRQQDGSTTRQFGGLGLGLAIVKHLVDAHGGQITATSPGLGQGATFTLQLPFVEMASAPPASPTALEVDLSGLKVLVVDDSEDARTLMAMLLRNYGAKGCVVATGTEALACLATFNPDVLICDIGMPDMDGYALLQQVRALPEPQGSNIPAIAVTAFAREGDRQRALASGFNQHVAKPFQPENLARAIAQLATK